MFFPLRLLLTQSFLYYNTVSSAGVCNTFVENGEILCTDDLPPRVGMECSLQCDESYIGNVAIITCEGADYWSVIPECHGKQDNMYKVPQNVTVAKHVHPL